MQKIKGVSKMCTFRMELNLTRTYIEPDPIVITEHETS